MKNRNVLFFIFCLILFSSTSLMGQIIEKQGVLSTHLSGVMLTGGDENSMFKPWGGFGFGYYFTKRLGLELTGSAGWTRPGEDEEGCAFKTYLYPVTLSMKYNFAEDKKLIPYVTAGGGILYWLLRDVYDEDDDMLPFYPQGDYVGESSYRDLFLLLGGGIQYFIAENISLDLGARYNYIYEHEKDMSGYGDEQSGIVELRFGINFGLKCDVDKDKDGILDKDDLCPDEPEDFDGFEDDDGCPDYDNDNDGIYDENDGAPNDPEDIDGYKDQDGIPDPDNDNDKILDVNDLAPLEPEDFDGYQDNDGKPDPDNDMDGILDVDDDCPNEPETFNGFQDEDGCPDKKPEIILEKKAPIVLEGITFATSSDDLTDEAKSVLGKVLSTLIDYPEIMLEIHGYTDDRGNRDFNIDLSQRRAQSVLDYLVEMGVAPERLTAKGFGPDNPVASNDTAEGRANNRRIEFVRVDE